MESWLLQSHKSACFAAEAIKLGLTTVTCQEINDFVKATLFPHQSLPWVSCSVLGC